MTRNEWAERLGEDISVDGATAAVRPRALPVFRTLADVAERRIEWLWPGRLPWGCPVVLAGDGATGKSTAAQNIGAGMTRGQAPPGGSLDRPRGVLILTTEEDAETVYRPRMRLMGADLHRVHDLDPEALISMKLPSGGDPLDAFCAEKDVGLIIVDTGPSFMDADLSSNKEEGIRRFMEPLNRIAQKHRLVPLVLAHLNKASGADSGHRLMGGAAWRNVPRVVLILGAPPGEDPRESRARILAVEKSNLGVYPNAVGLDLIPNPEDESHVAVRWGKEIAGVRAGDLVGRPPDSEERNAIDDAKEWLRGILANGPRASKEVITEAADADITRTTLHRARTVLKCTSERVGFGRGSTVLWSLPSIDSNPREYGEDTP